VTQQTVLLVDDEPDILQLLEITLARMNLQTQRATSIEEAKRLLESCTPDLCLTDMKLPDGNGLTLIDHIQHRHPSVPVAMITAHGSVESAIEALKLGAFDFVTKPLALEKLRNLVGHALQIKKDTDDLTSEELIGQSELVVALRDQIRRVARSQAPIHIHGESGVGKEITARLIHSLGPRSNQPFIAVNCGAIPPELVESELFGHKKGAFTGATVDKPGLFLAASGGTLLLDEIADLPLPVQVKLLRAVQEKSVRPVGSEAEIPVDVRLLSATHKNLGQQVRAGAFRDDLYYRLNVIGIHVPALRERKEDIPLLAEFLLKKLAVSHGTDKRALSEEAISLLLQYQFPGNIRELDNILARAVAMSDRAEIAASDIAFEETLTPPQTQAAAATVDIGPDQRSLLEKVRGDLEGFLTDTERQILEEALTKNRWNKTATAKALGITFRSLRYRLKKLGLDD
jgi:two-component system response regulator PilR (NtrC family)